MSRAGTVTGWRSAAAIASTSVANLRRLVEQGDLPAEKLGGVWSFAEADLRALAEGVSPAPVRLVTAEPCPEQQATSSGPTLTAQAFSRFAEGGGVAELVIEIGIEPEAAHQLYHEWTKAVSAGDKAEDVRRYIELRSQMDADGLTYDDLAEALDALDAVRLGSLWTGPEAAGLLQAAADRFPTPEAALQALQAADTAEEAEARAWAAEERQEAAQHAAVAAAAGATRMRERIAGLAPYLGWLRLAEGLAEATQPDGGTAALREALLRVPLDCRTALDALADLADPGSEEEAKVALALWAAKELPDHLVLRSEHEAGLQRARRDRQLRDVVVGALAARG